MPSRDLSKACWRCAHWGGFVHLGMNHSTCSRLNASPMHASTANGCAYWTPGPGNSLPLGWMPVGFTPWDGPRIYGKPPAEDARPPAPRDERPYLPCDQFEFDQKTDAAAWRLTGELLNRSRRGNAPTAGS